MVDSLHQRSQLGLDYAFDYLDSLFGDEHIPLHLVEHVAEQLLVGLLELLFHF